MERNQNVDFMRGIATILVLWGHTMWCAADLNSYNNNIHMFICSFHMPLFMLLSGYFATGMFKKKWSKVAIVQSLWLIVPILVWGTEKYFREFVWDGKMPLSLKDWIFMISQAGLWFLYVIIFCKVVFCTLNLFKNRWCFHLGACFVFIVVLIGCEYIQPMRMIAYMYLYYYLGIIFRQNSWEKKKTVIAFRNVAAICFGVLLMYYSQDAYIYTTGMALHTSQIGAGRQLGINIYRYIIGIAGSCMIWVVAEWLQIYKENNWHKRIQWIGRKSLQFYCLNYITVGWMGKIWNSLKEIVFIKNGFSNELIYTYIIVPITLLIEVILITYFIKLVGKNKIFSKLLFGR